MSRICELTGASVMSGHNVSHSERKTKRKFLPNLHHATLTSDVLKMNYRLRVAAGALRSVEANGGLDGYLLSAKDSNLSPRAKIIKKQLKLKKLEAK